MRLRSGGKPHRVAGRREIRRLSVRYARGVHPAVWSLPFGHRPFCWLCLQAPDVVRSGSIAYRIRVSSSCMVIGRNAYSPKDEHAKARNIGTALARGFSMPESRYPPLPAASMPPLKDKDILVAVEDCERLERILAGHRL